MDKIEKYLRRLSKSDRLALANALELLSNGKTKKLNIKKLKGYADIYRIRIGQSRVIFQQTDQGVQIIDIARRNEKTYKNF